MHGTTSDEQDPQDQPDEQQRSGEHCPLRTTKQICLSVNRNVFEHQAHLPQAKYIAIDEFGVLNLAVIHSSAVGRHQIGNRATLGSKNNLGMAGRNGLIFQHDVAIFIASDGGRAHTNTEHRAANRSLAPCRKAPVAPVLTGITNARSSGLTAAISVVSSGL